MREKHKVPKFQNLLNIKKNAAVTVYRARLLVNMRCDEVIRSLTFSPQTLQTLGLS